MPDFSQRSTLPEIMDQSDISAIEITQALKEIEVINQLLGGFNVITDALEKLKRKESHLTILDFGSGGGDVLRKIADWAEQRKVNVKLIGVDWNPIMTNYAIEHSIDYNNIQFKTLDVFDDNLLNEKADITTSTLFCHHFDDDDLVKLLNRMYHVASKSVVINDLHRHWFAYYSIKMITFLFSKTYLVRYDAALSVARSLTKKEWVNVLEKAGILSYKIKWMWAWRWQIIIYK